MDSLADQLNGNPNSTNGNRGISKIEGGPVVPAHEKIQEINNRSQPDPVNQVPHSSSENKTESKKNPRFALGLPAGPVDQNDYGGYGQQDQKVKNQAALVMIHNAEGHTPVPDENKVEKTSDDRD